MAPSLLVFALSGALLLWHAGPSAALSDGGELSAAAAQLDVAHPTGFAVDLVLARALMLLPLGDLAHRANLCVALEGALALALLSSVLERLLRERGALTPRAAWLLALLPLALCASPTVLRGATAMEVYASSLAVSAGALALALACEERPWGLALLGALGGLSVGMHTNARLSSFLCALAVGLSLRGARARLAASLRVAVLGLGGAAVALYLPAASRAQRYLDWGDPETPAALWRHLTGARIREAFSGRMLVAWRVPEDLARALRVTREDLGLPLLLLAAGGALLALRQRGARLVLALGLADLAYAVLLNPMGIADRQVLFVFEGCACVLAGLAVERAASALGARAGERTAELTTGLAALFLLASSAARFDARAAARADSWTSAELFGGGGALASVPLRGVLLCEGDNLCGGVAYAQSVEGERPDVSALPRQHARYATVWRRLRAEALGAPVPEVSASPEGTLGLRRLRALLRAYGPRVRWEPGDRAEARVLRVRLALAEVPVLQRVTPDGDPRGSTAEAMTAWLLARVSEGNGARRAAAPVLVSAGLTLAAARGVDAAEPLWRAALGLDPESPGALTDLAVVAAAHERYAEAEALLRAALRSDPDREVAWSNLALYARARGDEAEAQRAEDRARARGLRVAPREGAGVTGSPGGAMPPRRDE